MDWICTVCGLAAKTNRLKCTRCGSAVWRPSPKKDPKELGGPIKRIAPRGLLLANWEKEAPIQDPRSIECGKCHAVIYRAEKGFDAKTFEEARKKHFSNSPGCDERR
jgi:ribosomal protein S27AE